MFSVVELNLFALHVTVSENLKVDALSSTLIIMKPLFKVLADRTLNHNLRSKLDIYVELHKLIFLPKNKDCAVPYLLSSFFFLSTGSKE